MLLSKIMNFLNASSSLPSSSAETTTTGTNLVFEPSRFVEMLPKMLIGMLVIFVLIGVIIIVTMLINKVFAKKTK